MTRHITLFRVLSRYYISRIVTIATYIAVSIALLLLIGIWALAHFFSPWWWLLVVPLLACIIAFFILRFLVSLVARIVYPDTVSKSQAAEIKAFINKINGLLELKNINPTMIALTSFKDFVLYRELRSLKSLINDSKTLSTDYNKLDDQFK